MENLGIGPQMRQRWPDVAAGRANGRLRGICLRSGYDNPAEAPAPPNALSFARSSHQTRLSARPSFAPRQCCAAQHWLVGRASRKTASDKPANRGKRREQHPAARADSEPSPDTRASPAMQWGADIQTTVKTGLSPHRRTSALNPTGSMDSHRSEGEPFRESTLDTRAKKPPRSPRCRWSPGTGTPQAAIDGAG